MKILSVGFLAFFLLPTWSAFAQGVPPNQRWIEQVNGGLVLPLSSKISTAYDPGFGGDMVLGYRFTRQFSLSLSLGYYDCDQVFYGADKGEFLYVPLMAVARYSIAVGRFRPYALLGVGASFNNQSFSAGAGGGPPRNSRTQTDLLLSPGVGFLYILGGDMAAYVQARLDLNFTPDSGLGMPPSDNPTIFVPVMAGVSFFPTD